MKTLNVIITFNPHSDKDWIWFKRSEEGLEAWPISAIVGVGADLKKMLGRNKSLRITITQTNQKGAKNATSKRTKTDAESKVPGLRKSRIGKDNVV
jgi:hypothetical protein